MVRKKRTAQVAVRSKNPGLVPGISDLINLTDEETEIQASSNNTDMAMIGEPSDLAKQHAKEEKDLFAVIEEVVDSKDIVPKDLKINDSSLSTALNYYDWCTNEEFLGSDMPPYLEQALIGIKLFSEYCYHCSDLEWMDDDGHDPQDGLVEFERRVVMLHHGVCPKCGARRSHMIKEEQLNYYNELAVNAGQRCVTGDTHVLTEDGIERIGVIGKDTPLGFSDFKKRVYNGEELETTSDFYRSKVEELYYVQLQNGFVLRGTGDHPIMTDKGFKQLRNINDCDIVPVSVGQNVWGTTVPNLKDIVRVVEADTKAKILKTPKTNQYQIKPVDFIKTSGKLCKDLYKVLGFWIAEGRYRGISNFDAGVNTFCYNTLCKYIDPKHLNLGKGGVEFKGFGAQSFIRICLGLTEEKFKSGSAGKTISDTLLKAPKEYLCALLQGMFEGDGSASHGQGKKIGGISYCSISRTLIYDVYTILVNIGIFPRIRKRNSWATNGSENQVSKPFWNIAITNDQAQLFKDAIGFFSARKSERVDQLIRRHESRNKVNSNNTVYNFLKPELGDILDKANAELNEISLPYWFRSDPEKFKTSKCKKTLGLYSLFKFNKELGCRHDKILKDGRALTRERIQILCKVLLENKQYFSNTLIAKIKVMRDKVADGIYLQPVRGCGLTGQCDETFDFTLPKTHRFVTQGVLSHNSGKSALVAMLSTYITHRILKSQKPTQLFRVKSNTVFHGTFVALTYAQAKDTLWEPYYQYLCESPWFQKYHALLRRYEQKYGHEIFKLKDTFVLYRHRSLMVYPAGPDKRTLRGRTRVFGSVDEIGWFDNDKNSGKVKINGSEVYIALERSLRTVRNSERRQIAAEYDQALTGYFMNISSPSSQRDKICELVRQSHGSKKLLGLHKPTWEMNPDVTRADLDDEFRKDHGTAMRDYGAQPPLSSNPFITSEELVKNIIKKTGRNFANITYKIYKAKDNSKYRWGFIDKVKSCDGKSVMAVDAGYSNNCFALAVGSLQKVEVDGHEVTIPVMDIVVEINPLPSIPLHYPKIYENVMIPLIEARNVKILLADRWNSIKLLQDAEISTDIDMWKQYSLKYSDFIDFKTRMQQKQILIPRPHVKQDFNDILAMSTDDEYPTCFERMPVEHFILQMLTVQDAGKTVIKGDDLTDDIWRAAVLCMWGLTNPDFIDNLKGSVESSKSKAALGVASFGSKSKASSSGASSGRRSSIGTAKSLGTNKG